jgi:hypothetical protein
MTGSSPCGTGRALAGGTFENTGATATGRRGSHDREASQAPRSSVVTSAAAERRITSNRSARWLTAQAAPRRPARPQG